MLHGVSYLIIAEFITGKFNNETHRQDFPW
jgi:hypothetical protein